MISAKENAQIIAKAMLEKNATEVQILKITNLSSVADYFVICTGTSNTQLKTIADEAERRTKEAGGEILNVEGYQGATWILVDAGAVVAHIFHTEMRSFYSLERLWGEAEQIAIDD